MDDQNAGAQQPAENLISRPPTEADLVNLCRELNRRGAKYVVIGGPAIIAAGRLLCRSPRHSLIAC